MKSILFIQRHESITFEPDIIVGPGECIFTSFIGKHPAKLQVDETAKVWEVVRCGARYHRGGQVKDINKDNAVFLFCDFFNLKIEMEKIELWKRVKDDFTDFFSGEYKYFPGTVVTAHDWIPNERIVCGNAIHLAPTKELSEQWNEEGRLLKCIVALEDICIFPYNISQVRCRQVQVKEEC